jgi:hypothetical protein
MTGMAEANGTNLPTVCVLCSHNCGIRVDVKDNRITAVRGDETNPISKGYVCNKAFSIQHYVEHGDRVPYPMRRRPDGTSEEIDWDTAITEIAAKLDAVRCALAAVRSALVGIGGQGNSWTRLRASASSAGSARSAGSTRSRRRRRSNLLDQWMPDASPARLPARRHQHAAQFLLVLDEPEDLEPAATNATDTFKMLAEGGRRARGTVVCRPARDGDDAHGDAPPAPPARHRRVICSSRWPRSSFARTSRTPTSSRSTRSATTSSAPSSAPSTSRPWRRAAGSASTRCSRRHAASRTPTRPRSSTTSASSRRRSRR